MKSRRIWLKVAAGGALAAPLALLGRQAFAATNAASRGALKYQDKPNGEQKCSNCLQFVPGKNPTDKGGCKIIPGDSEISPSGYCVAWAKKA
jgi:anaerobic selenocysteine-containing dehydrogenase